MNQDGSISQVIGKNGGHMEGPNGIALDAIADTFPSGAIVTIKSVAEADFPATLTPEQALVFNYTAGLTLDFGGATPQHYLNVSVPAGPADKVDDRWVVSQVIQVDGQPVMNAVDTAKLINGRVATSSPPCPGVLAAGMYGIHKSAKMMAVVYGSGAMQQTADIYRAIASQSLSVGGSSDGVSMAMPGGAYFDNTFNFCLPIMTSRITLTRNTVDILVPVDRIARNVLQVQVRNTNPDRDNSWRFSRDEFYVVLRAPAAAAGGAVVATYTDGSTSPLPFVAAPGAGGSTIFRIAADAIPASATGATIAWVGSAASVALSFARSDLRVAFAVQGGMADIYQVTKTSTTVDPTGALLQSNQVEPLFFTEPSSLGPGPLVVRALPGTIDPTVAEITAYNADVAAWNAAHPTEPPRVPIVSGGRNRTKVEVRHVNAATSTDTLVEVPGATIVGGGFAYTFTGGLTPGDKYSVVVSYAPPFPQEVIDLPVFTLKLQNAGNIVKVITLPSPPMDQPLKLPPLVDDVIPPDLRGDLLAVPVVRSVRVPVVHLHGGDGPRFHEDLHTARPHGRGGRGPRRGVRRQYQADVPAGSATEARHDLQGDIRRRDRSCRQHDCRRAAPVDGREDGDAEDGRDGDVRERDAGAAVPVDDAAGPPVHDEGWTPPACFAPTPSLSPTRRAGTSSPRST